MKKQGSINQESPIIKNQMKGTEDKHSARLPNVRQQCYIGGIKTVKRNITNLSKRSQID